MAIRTNIGGGSIVGFASVAAAVLLLGCGEDAEGAPSDRMNSSSPVPGRSAEGWQSAFADVAGRCSSTEAELGDLAHVTVGNTTLYVGYEQVSSDNQDPLVIRYDAGELVYCRYHESEGPDGRAVGVTWDGGEIAYVVYTVVGGGTALEGKGGWLSSYAPGAISGGGPKVSVVGRVNVADGGLSSASFIMALTGESKVNTHRPKDAVTVLEDGNVEFLGESAHKPIDADGQSAMECSDYPFDSRYRFSADLSSLVCADCSNCTAQRPCP
jgi:hypothetical protein